jgi:hypothetical protein
MRTKFPKSALQKNNTFICGVCDVFYNSKAYYDTDRKLPFKTCKQTDKEVMYRSKGCETHFVLAQWFHCEPSNNRITPLVCLDRQRDKRGCRKDCAIGKLIRNLLGR